MQPVATETNLKLKQSNPTNSVQSTQALLDQNWRLLTKTNGTTPNQTETKQSNQHLVRLELQVLICFSSRSVLC
jgi:hypothetical protein